MATFNSTQYAQRATANAVGTPLNANLDGGKIRRKYATLPATVGLAQNDLVNLFVLPKGAIPIAYVARYGAFGASVTLDIGYSGAEATFKSALDVSAAGVTMAATLGNVALTADTIVQAKFEGANPADDKVLEVELWYVVD